MSKVFSDPPKKTPGASHRLAADRSAGRVALEQVVGAGRLDGDLVVDGAGADVVDLGDDVGRQVVLGLAVVGPGGPHEEGAAGDLQGLGVAVEGVPVAAEGEGLARAVLSLPRSAGTSKEFPRASYGVFTLLAPPLRAFRKAR
jgi:hypothetical protein